MRKQTGFFQLQSPLNLLDKMEFDYTVRMQTNPIDVYAAFDFFVTAEHLPEWLGKAKCSPGAPKNAEEQAYRNICSQLANGAKHFAARKQDAVVGAEAIDGAFDPAIFDPAIFDTGELILELGDTEAAALGNKRISAVMLAGFVLAHWKGHPAIERCAKLEQEREAGQH